MIFSGITWDNPSSSVREEVCHFIQAIFVHCIVLQLWLYTSWCIHFELISKSSPYCLWDLIDVIFEMHLAPNNIGRQKLKTKDFFNSTEVDTIISTIIALRLNLSSPSTMWLKTSFNNFQKKLISCVDSLFTSIVGIQRMCYMAGWYTNKPTVL